VWQIDESGFDPEFEMDPRLCSFVRRGETYWSSGELDWLVYSSHEESITFAGRWLVGAVKAAWPTWSERLYTVPGYP